LHWLAAAAAAAADNDDDAYSPVSLMCSCVFVLGQQSNISVQ